VSVGLVRALRNALRLPPDLPDNRGMSNPAPPNPAALPVVTTITVYGADWCGDCRRTKRWLNTSGIEWTWIDRDADPEVRRMLADAGYRAIPVVILPSGRVLVEPSDAQLSEAVGSAA
jgi:glutaredoxin